MSGPEGAKHSIAGGTAGPSPVSRPGTAPSRASSPGSAERLRQDFEDVFEAMNPFSGWEDMLKKHFTAETVIDAGPADGHGGAPSGVCMPHRACTLYNAIGEPAAQRGPSAMPAGRDGTADIEMMQMIAERSSCGDSAGTIPISPWRQIEPNA